MEKNTNKNDELYDFISISSTRNGVGRISFFECKANDVMWPGRKNCMIKKTQQQTVRLYEKFGNRVIN